MKAFGDRDDESSLPSGFRGSFLDEIDCILCSSPKIKTNLSPAHLLLSMAFDLHLKCTSDIAL
jgi:hypothetical protein